MRIFVSSPGDVTAAREIAALTVERLAQDYSRFFHIEPYLWEFETMVASGHFQDSIEPPSAFDVVVLIVWSRLGTPLPERTALREYRGIDGRTPVTGTEWEFEEALQSARMNGAPDLLVYRSRQPASFDTNDPGRLEEQLRQLRGLNSFWERHFVNQGTYLSAFSLFATEMEFAAIFENHLRKLIEKRIAALGQTARGAPGTAWAKAPFRGLESYEFEHAPIFFGQDEALTKAMLQLTASAATGSPFLLVLGASGSGKSSLVKAGVLPKLFVPRRVPGIAFLRRVIFRPSDARDGEDLFDALARNLTSATGQNEGMPELLGSAQTSADLARHLRTATAEPAYPLGLTLGQLTEHARRDGRMLVSESARLALVVDQLEELFTDERLTPDERRRFIELIAGLVRSGLVWVVATMRKDFWHRADETPDLVRLAEGRGRLELLPPGPAQVSQMIRRPADAAGVLFEMHGTTNVPLNEVIAEEVDREPGALPLLSYLLDQLYRRDVLELRGHALSYATYEQLGRLEGAIATQAEAVLEHCLPQDRSALGSVLFSLVEMNAADGSVERAVARRVPLSAFAPGTAQRRLVDALRDRDARLLVSDAETEGSPTVRVAHEALISRWSEARDFVRGNAEALKIRRRIEERYALWQSAAQTGNRQTRFGREPGLLSDIDLADGQRLLREHRDDTDSHLVRYIERSIADDERIRTRSTRLLAGIAGVVTLLAVIASAAGIIASRRQHDAEYQTAETLHTEARLLVEAASQHLKDSDVAGAQGIILEVLTNPAFAQRHSSAAINTFQEARAADALQVVFSGHSDIVHAASFSPDGTHVVTASSDATARIWDTATGIPLAMLAGHTGEILSAAYSPDGAYIVTGSTDKTARIWDVKSGSTIMILRGHEGVVTAVAFSPDGARIVTASNDKTARIWDARLGRQIGVLTGHGGTVLDAAFSPDGTRLVTASQDKTARIWDSRNYSQTGLLSGHEEIVHSAAWSPDGRSVVTASWDKTARIWDARSGAQTAVMTGHTDTLGSAAYSPDGTHVVTTATDKTARIWDAHSGAPIAVLTGHGAPVVHAVYSPDGTQILTASWDATARIWDTRSVEQIRVIAGHGRTVFSAAFSPDGTRILTGSQDRTAREWDARSGAALLTLSGHGDSVGSARYSLDGARIVTGSNDKTARIWDAGTGAAITMLKSADGQIDGAAFSPDGSHIATAHQYRVARIWDARSGAPIAALSGHDGIVDSIDYSPDGARLVTASDDRTARIWDAATAKQLTVLSGHAAAVYSAVYSRDGTRIVTASADKTARIWDAASGKPLVVLDGHRNSVESAAFSPDGTRVVTASDDRTARLWDARTGEQLMVLSGHDDIVESARFSPDGKRVVTGSDDATARIWDVRMPAGLDAQIAWDQAAQVDSMSDLDRTRLGLPADAHTGSHAARATGATPCDLAAAAFYDPDRLIPGVAPWKVNADIAKQACSAETAKSDHPARLDYETGRALLANHDPDGARREFELAVSRGYRSAQIDLANLLRDPPDGKPDTTRAVALYEHAWVDGVTTAAFALGQVHETAGDAAQAWAWYRKGADAREPAALASFAQRAEQEALVASDPGRKTALLLDAFRHYAAAAAYARGEGWPDEAWRQWRHRRATLARLLARDGRMSEAADAYAAVLAGSAAVPPTLWKSLVAKLQR